MILLLALALATMPRPVAAWADDLTAVYAAANFTKPSSVRAELTIDPSGKPVHCDIVVSSTVRTIDTATCGHLLRNARFSPARDASGAPVVAVVRTDTSFNKPRDPALSKVADADSGQIDVAVPVSGLPADHPVYVSDVVLAMSSDGKVVACAVGRSSGMAQLDRLACRQAMAMTFSPGRNRDGTPVAALRALSIGFTAGPVPQ